MATIQVTNSGNQLASSPLTNDGNRSWGIHNYGLLVTTSGTTPTLTNGNLLVCSSGTVPDDFRQHVHRYGRHHCQPRLLRQLLR